MKYEEKANSVLEVARKLSSKTKSWIEFSNQIFSPHGGAIAKAFPSDDERKTFSKSKQYAQIHELQVELMRKYGVANNVATKSGKFIVRVPKTLHSRLEIEADREGVSLNQLAVTKLSVSLHQASELSPLLIIRAFTEIHDGYAADRVICDPILNCALPAKVPSNGVERK